MTLKILLGFTTIAALAACSPKKFSQSSSAPAVDGQGTVIPNGPTTDIPGGGPGGGDQSNSGNPSNPPPSGNGNTPAAQLPKVTFYGPTCQRLTECQVIFTLDKTYPSVVEFDWNTNDTLYGTPSAPNLPPWGKPGYRGDASAQYVPTSGHVAFAAGTNQAIVHVSNINQQNTAISIGVQWNNCAYDGLYEDCASIFTNNN